MGTREKRPPRGASASGEKTVPPRDGDPLPEDGHIGVDESGKGDYFGPLVVAAVFVGPEHLAELEGVRDSKRLTDPRVLRLGPAIRRACPHKVLVVSPERYNALYREIGNLNRLLSWAHARAIEDLVAIRPARTAISDRFADPAELERRLRARGVRVTLVSEVRAERDIAVAAASVVARDEFLRRLRALGESFGMELPKGAGPRVPEVARAFVRAHGPDQLGRVAKLHFRTTREVLGELDPH